MKQAMESILPSTIKTTIAVFLCLAVIVVWLFVKRDFMKQAMENILLSPIDTTIFVFLCLAVIVVWLFAKRDFMKRVMENILLSPIKTTIAVFLCTAVLVVWLSAEHYSDPSFYPSILVEAHGMLLDMVVVGIFLLLIDNFRNTKNEISKNKELIDDLRYWKSDEASYRIKGAIIRLNKLGISSADLEGCHLKSIDLQSISLRGSKLFSADLGGANIRKVDVSECNLKGAYLGDADCRSTSFENSSLHRTRCRRANMTAASFVEARLEKTEFFETNLQNADFRGAKLEGCKFNGANLRQANFKGASIVGVKQFVGARDLHLAIFDQSVMALIENECGIVFSDQRKQLAGGQNAI